MGRALRTIDSEWIYHAGSRGSNRGPIVWDERDYESLVGEIARAARRHRWQVYAWCVMPNHYHLVLRTPHGGFSKGFQQINGNHARRINRRYGRTAHLFENRPWDRLLRSTAHLLAAVPYVLRNPVTAGLCVRAVDWPYSSLRATLGLEPAPPWLAVEELLALVGATIDDARLALLDLVENGHVLVSDTI